MQEESLRNHWLGAGSPVQVGTTARITQSLKERSAFPRTWWLLWRSTCVYRDSKPTFLKIKVQTWPLVQKFGYINSENHCCSEEALGKNRVNDRGHAPAPCSQDCTRAAPRGSLSKAPDSPGLVFRAQQMGRFPSAGLCSAPALGDACLRAEPLPSLVEHEAEGVHRPFLWSSRHITLTAYLQRVARLYQRSQDVAAIC